MAPELPESTFEAYYAALKGYEPETIAEGVKRFCLYSGSDFFPSLPKLAKWITEPFEAQTPVEHALDRVVELSRKTLEARYAFMENTLKDFMIEPSDEGEGNRHVFVREWSHSVDPYRDRWRWQLEPAQHNGRSLCLHTSPATANVARGFVCAGCVNDALERRMLRDVFPESFLHHLTNSFRVIAAKVQGLIEAGDAV
jgi:hypothetical protein